MNSEGGDTALFHYSGGTVAGLLFVLLGALEAYIPVMVAVITSGALSSYTTLVITRRKTDAEATQGFVNAAATATSTLEKAVIRLEKEMNDIRSELIVAQAQHEEMQARLERSTKQVKALTKQNEELGCEIRRLTAHLHSIIPLLPAGHTLPADLNIPPPIGE